MIWRTDLLLDAVETALSSHERHLCVEHAVYGLDALAEIELHPILAAGFEQAGFGVEREQPYPHEWRSKKLKSNAHGEILPERRDRMRCDLVLTSQTGVRIADPLDLERTIQRHRRDLEGSLFQSLASSDEAALVNPSPQCSAPEDAYWLEVKLIAQNCYNDGIPGPNTQYASELRRTINDLAKLMDDERVVNAGLLLLHFGINAEVARHDLTKLVHGYLDRQLPVAAPQLRVVPIRERIGNTILTVSHTDLRKL